MIDTHCHIYEPEFAEDLEQVVERAQQAGVQQVFLPNINEASIQPMLEVCSRYPEYAYPMLGLHPEDVKGDYAAVLDRMEQRLLQPDHPFIAIGEVGLDFYWDKTYATEQRRALHKQVEWAERFNLPLVIHTRSAHQPLMDILSGHESLRGIFHCFGGSADEAAELLAFPLFKLGIGGVLTFKKSNLPEVLRQMVPLDRIVLETDAPYLAPVPFRGKRNEPSYLPFIVERLAETYNTTKERIIEQTTINTREVFNDLNKI